MGTFCPLACFGGVGPRQPNFHLGWQGGTAMSDKLRRHHSIPKGRSPTKPCPNPRCKHEIFLTALECPRCKIQIRPEDRKLENIPCPYCREFIPAASENCPKCNRKIYRPRSVSKLGKPTTLPAPTIGKPTPDPPSSASQTPARADNRIDSPANRNIVTWADTFKIMLAVACAPIARSFLLYGLEAARSYLCLILSCA